MDFWPRFRPAGGDPPLPLPSDFKQAVFDVTATFRAEAVAATLSLSAHRQPDMSGADCNDDFRAFVTDGQLGDGQCFAGAGGALGADWVLVGLVGWSNGYTVDVQLIEVQHPDQHRDVSFKFGSRTDIAAAVHGAWRDLIRP